MSAVEAKLGIPKGGLENESEYTHYPDTAFCVHLARACRD